MNKQAQEVIFSKKMPTSFHLQISFYNIPVFCASFQKQLGIQLVEKLLWPQEKMAKTMKGTDVIKILSRMVPPHSLLKICKSFLQPHLGYDDVLYVQ